MKKCLCVFLSIVCISSLFAVNTSADNSLKGDIDGNGVLSLHDAYLIFDAIINKEQYDEKMDIDSNNRLSAADFRILSKIVINGKTKQSEDIYDLCANPLFHSDDTLAVTIPIEYIDIVTVSETINEIDSGVNHSYTVKSSDISSLNNLVLLITFPENSVNCEDDIYFNYKSNDIAAFDYEWRDGQLLIGMTFSNEKKNDTRLFSFSCVTEEGMNYKAPALEVFEYNSYLNGNACFHSGGTATCIETKVCDYCGVNYGFKSNHNGGNATCDKQAVCELCGADYGEMIEHVGGVASCSEKAKCEFCRQEYGNKLPHMNSSFSGICDICGDDFSAETSGINTSVLIFNDYLLYTIYFTDVESISDISFELKYDSYVFFNSEYTYFGDFIKADVNCVPGTTYVYKCNFTTADGYKIDHEMPILISFALYYRENELFTYDKIPEILNFTFANAVMTDNSAECTINDVIAVDSRHEHMDNDSDCFCDLCTVLIIDASCGHIDNNYDCKCDVCGSPVFYYGDMNCDGKISASDARIALRISARMQETTIYTLFVGDFDGNGQITASEARKILRVAAMIDTF